MAGSAVTVSPTRTADVENTGALEDTPLLGDVYPQERMRRSSSIVGNTEHGYHTIPASVPDSPENPPQHNLRSVLSILSVLLIGY